MRTERVRRVVYPATGQRSVVRRTILPQRAAPRSYLDRQRWWVAYRRLTSAPPDTPRP